MIRCFKKKNRRQVIVSRETLRALIANRPNGADEIKESVEKAEYNYPHISKNESTVESPAKHKTDDWTKPEDRRRFKTIKDSSPFTAVFAGIEAEVDNEPDDQDLGDYEPNELYYPAFIQFLQKYFLPYIFIWGGYVFRGIDSEVVWITQGCVERMIGDKKQLLHNKELVPARYARETVDFVIGQSMVQRKELNGKNDEASEDSDDSDVDREIEQQPRNGKDMWKPDKLVDRNLLTQNRLNKVLKSVPVNEIIKKKYVVFNH